METTQKEISVYDILKSCIKKRPNNTDKTVNISACVTDVQLGRFNGTGREDVFTDELYDVLLSRTLSHQKLNIQLCGEFIRFEYTFSSSTSPDLKIFLSALNKYAEYKNLKSAEEDDTWRYSMLLTLIPDEYNGKYTVSIMNPIIWGLSSSKTNTILLDRLYVVLPTDKLTLNKYEF